MLTETRFLREEFRWICDPIVICAVLSGFREASVEMGICLAQTSCFFKTNPTGTGGPHVGRKEKRVTTPYRTPVARGESPISGVARWRR